MNNNDHPIRDSTISPFEDNNQKVSESHNALPIQNGTIPPTDDKIVSNDYNKVNGKV